MIDQFCVKTSGKKLILQVKGDITLIGEPQENKKPKLIDMAFGNSKDIINDLKNQGYEIEII